MTKFYITTNEISQGLGISRYKASKVFQQIKDLARENGTPLIDRSTVPTSLLCKHLKISQTDFTENIKKVSDKRDLNKTTRRL